MVRLNGIIRSVIPIPHPYRYPSMDNSEEPNPDEKGNLLNEVSHYFNKSGTGDSEQDQEDSPNWMFDNDEVLAP